LKSNYSNPPVKGVVMQYRFPLGVQGAWAVVKDQPEGLVSYCGSSDSELRCMFSSIAPGDKVILSVYVLPGPLTPETEVPTPTPQQKAGSSSATSSVEPTLPARTGSIKNEGTFTLGWFEKDMQCADNERGNDGCPDRQGYADIKLAPGGDKATKVVMPNIPSISAQAIPAVNVAAVGLPVKISILAWENGPTEKTGEETTIDLKFTLPQGMRFADYPKDPARRIRTTISTSTVLFLKVR
jgi:hypothetical protein